ncbi:MAG: helix-turn-helix domain-containing protein [Fimbriimonadales bacterium]|jgi:excisionase family DNA binding protein|nr:helix-turn-helix domain-containing protein [Armatimonadota bacterium]MCX7686805.1 helix-turn-helix domain-containing protein [Fimbriimonadales bacterium]CUU05640.1 DNA binding domain-containing protein, excisionase family [Armatimonadetes bacterium GBS]CUU36208.1 DNA binding domain-containing protein, excisionase family [Armatimonadetes bacterium GXS]CUU37921.1 DNA binding domain-containing protein, excisionase family [Armatimonadetes bacterium DC]GBC90353.1 hypothetical protein HRbin14_010
MNLVEAIRLASQKREGTENPPAPASSPNAEPGASGEREEMQTVRFEVRLTNQQLYDLLSWLARSLHPVMTLKEAAHYLRLRPAELQQMAEQGIIPAFKVDHRWRFLKTALDEWMILQRATDATPETTEGERNEKSAENESAA